MSDRRSPARQPSPETARLAGIVFAAADHAVSGVTRGSPVAGPSPVLPVLAGVLLLVLWLMLTGTHLAAGQRLGILIGPSPLPPLSAAQLGKVAALVGVGLLCGGAILLALQCPHGPADRRLAHRCLWLLGPGAVLAVALDLAPAVWPTDHAARVVHLAEVTVEWVVLGGCAALLGHRAAALGTMGRERRRQAGPEARRVSRNMGSLARIPAVILVSVSTYPLRHLDHVGR